MGSKSLARLSQHHIAAELTEKLTPSLTPDSGVKTRGFIRFLSKVFPVRVLNHMCHKKLATICVKQKANKSEGFFGFYTGAMAF
jgi:hypothetical protein